MILIILNGNDISVIKNGDGERENNELQGSCNDGIKNGDL